MAMTSSLGHSTSMGAMGADTPKEEGVADLLESAASEIERLQHRLEIAAGKLSVLDAITKIAAPLSISQPEADYGQMNHMLTDRLRFRAASIKRVGG